METEELEKWCSEACARRALYVRVQLSETAAWERDGDAKDVDLLDESKEDSEIVKAMAELDLDGEKENVKKSNATDLALERGDNKKKATKVDVTIQEKDVQGAPEPPSLDGVDLSGRLDTMHLNLEGHISTLDYGSRRHRRHEEEHGEGDDWF